MTGSWILGGDKRPDVVCTCKSCHLDYIGTPGTAWCDACFEYSLIRLNRRLGDGGPRPPGLRRLLPLPRTNEHWSRLLFTLGMGTLFFFAVVRPFFA